MDLRKPMSLGDRFRLLVKKPGWLPDHLGGYRNPPEITEESAEKYDTKAPIAVHYYILFQYLVLLAGTAGFLFNVEAFTFIEQILISSYILFSIVNMGALFDNRSWVGKMEIFRMLILILGSLYFYIYAGLLPPFAIMLLLATAIGSVLWFLSVNSANPDMGTPETVP